MSFNLFKHCFHRVSVQVISGSLEPFAVSNPDPALVFPRYCYVKHTEELGCATETRWAILTKRPMFVTRPP